MQRSFDDLGTPLCEVTFVVIDLETTGGSPRQDAITEVGAVKLRGGECLGTFQTLVNPGASIPPAITYLTGITEAMVAPAPPIGAVLPSLAEFMSGAVIVGHNVRFDLGFLRAAFDRGGWPRMTNRSVDTCLLARRLVRDEVPNCKLATLARLFGTAHQPTHRALDDALATGEVLHGLLERAGTWGVTGLDDLLALPTVQGHPQLAKLKLARDLPRLPGVYMFKDARGQVLYIGKATDLRRRVRSYFTGDGRRKIGPMLRELNAVDHIVCAGDLEASVLELRMIRELDPRYNRQGRRRRQVAAWLKLTLGERWPRLAIVRSVRDDGGLYLGPLPSTRFAREVVDAVYTASPIRRCALPAARARVDAPCVPAQLGAAVCPCAGGVTDDEYAEIVEVVRAGLTRDPTQLLAPLAQRMRALAAASRFEEAADVRDRASALTRAISKQRRAQGLIAAGRLELTVAGEGDVVIEAGLMTSGASASRAQAAGEDEVGLVASWLDQKHAKVTVVEAEGPLASPLPRLPAFEPVTPRSRRGEQDPAPDQTRGRS